MTKFVEASEGSESAGYPPFTHNPHLSELSLVTNVSIGSPAIAGMQMVKTTAIRLMNFRFIFLSAERLV